VRCLILGCGCRGLALASTLRDAGHAVRGTTREAARGSVLSAAGVEPFICDPDRIGTLVPALEHVTAACILLGSAAGDRQSISALHGPRLEMLLEKLIDTTVRGLVYEAAGTVAADVLERGATLVRAASDRSHISCSLLTAEPADHEVWLAQAVVAVESVLAIDSSVK
jgi:hypothetical protein